MSDAIICPVNMSADNASHMGWAVNLPMMVRGGGKIGSAAGDGIVLYGSSAACGEGRGRLLTHQALENMFDLGNE